MNANLKEANKWRMILFLFFLTLVSGSCALGNVDFGGPLILAIVIRVLGGIGTILLGLLTIAAMASKVK